MKGAGKIEVSPRGVLIRDRDSSVHFFEWGAVDRILTYKLDLITTDDVCLEFRTGNRSYVIDEEADGWSELTAQVCERFSISARWFANVVQPPFATNMAVLWSLATDDALARFAGADIDELWRVSSFDFANDGSSRAMYFIESTIEGWNGMLAVARGMFGAVKVNRGAHELPHDLTAKHFTGKKRPLVQLSVGGIGIAGYCFSTTDIELRFAPEQLQSSGDLAQLLRFVIAVSSYLNTPGVITPEHVREAPIFQVQPTGVVEFCSRPRPNF